MEFVFVYRDENGEITGSATHAENGEKMSVDNPEYVAWLNKVYPPSPDQLYKAAEAWINKFFTASQLLQFKVWWDAYPHEATPKLGAISVWQTGVTKKAFEGSNEFDPAPYTFDEVANEVLSIPTN